jgi:hypothetical protein
MALSSRGFSGSPKMNKDADERVVPNGEYRDALNVQVTSSDDSEVGSLQSLLGNTLLSTDIVPEGSKCVGSIADNKNDKIYYFVAGPVWEDTDLQEGVWKDYIIQHDVKTGAFKYVFVDIYRVQLRTIGPSVGRDLPVSFNVSTSPWTYRGAIRRDMPIAAFNASGAPITSPNWTLNNQLTEVVNFLPITASTANVNIYSSMVDYNVITVPTGTLLRFQPSPILNFHEIARQDKLITGINIIDDMLLWTDNYSEPKKINIDRCIAGTGGSVELPPINTVFIGDNANFHTRLCVTPDKNSNLIIKPRVNNPGGKPWYVIEENITVIKKGPWNCPRLIMSPNEEGRDNNPVWASTNGTNWHICGPPSTSGNSFSIAGTTSCASSGPAGIKKEGDTLTNVRVATPVDWRVGDLILFNQQQDINSAEGFNDHDVRCTVTSIPATMPSTGPYSFLIEQIDANKIDQEQKKWNLRLEQRKPLFEFKFVRFAFRYKYEDGEYSTFSPWSEPAFLPGEYDYLPVKGYNLGMTNRLRQLKVTGYIPEDMPQDVVQVDILYKDESSPNIYLVEEIASTDGWSQRTEKLWPDKLGFERKNPSIPSSYIPAGSNAWRGEYKLTSELIHKTLPSNQLLRQWDNVPRLALAQEISGNRLVYGNYIQNFDITDPGSDLEIRPIINVRLHAMDAPLNVGTSGDTTPLNDLDTTTGYVTPSKTCRSLRTYQVGVVYGDKYGRETPVLAGADGTGSLVIPIENSSTINKLRVDIGSKAPSFAKYYKLFVKETSNEYYNLAMDRHYDAEDGNMWLSFASSDRNKVDLETLITLKKKHDSHVAVTDKCTYKILAIENKAPDFIKTNVKSLGMATGTIGDSAAGFPMPDTDEIWISSSSPGSERWYNESIKELLPVISDGLLYMRVRTANIKSNWYQVTILKEQSSFYKFKSDKPFKEDTTFTSTGGSFQTKINGLMLELAIHKVENKKEFEGRFFVKIYKDLALLDNIKQEITQESRVRIIQSQPIGYWNIPAHTYNGIDVGSEMVNWERVGVILKGEMDVSSDCNSWDNAAWGGSGDISAGATGRNDAFFYKTCRSGWIHDCDGYTCPRRDHTAQWMQNSAGLFHIDGAISRGTRKANGKVCSGDTLRKNDAVDNVLRGRGIYSNGAIPFGSMDLAYVHLKEYEWMKGSDETFITLMRTTGTVFRFREDPDKISYIVTGGEGKVNNGADNSRYGQHHNYHEDTSGEDGNGRTRWRINFERNDGSCTGMGGGESGYYILGNKNTTATAGMAELGYYGGVGLIGNQWWESDSPSNGEAGDGVTTHTSLTDSMRVPAPLGTYSSQAAAQTALDNDLDEMWNGQSGMPPHGAVRVCLSGTGASRTYWKRTADGASVTSFTGLQQAKRYRDSTAKTHFIEIIEPLEDEDGDWSSKNPAVWETVPKEDVGMDIYYEASPALPITIEASTNELFAPYGSMVNRDYSPFVTNPTGTTIASWSDNKVYTTTAINIQGGDRMRFTRPDGLATTAISNADPSQPWPGFANVNNFTIRAHNQDPAPYNPLQEPPIAPISSSNNFSDAPHNQGVYLSWYNAFTWGNGIESDRIRDDFNQVTIANGVKASTVMATPYKEERRKTGLIHSGIYNSTSGVNSLNQFIQAESITKDMNPTYGSIQKLYTTDGNIVAFHEDRVMKILAQKDALYNAGGGKNVAISSNFLGSDEPYATTHGISTNPESFAVDSFGRQYFADRSRSSICRLSQSGIDAISTYGMKDWFDDHLNSYTTKILGSFDEKKGLYNVTIFGAITDDVSDKSYTDNEELTEGPCDCNEVVSGDFTYSNSDLTYFGRTLSFSEETKGWTTFKSFVPEDGVSINNEYYTFKNGNIYKHHSNSTRNNFYGVQFDSSVSVIFNDEPASVKSFMTINYEGSQARTTSSLTDSEYHNLNNKDGWYVDNIVTDLQDCENLEFIDKEGKWFSYIQGITTTLKNLDESEFSVQGIGVVTSVIGVGSGSDRIHCLTIKPNAICVESVLDPDDGEIIGCMDPSAANYNMNANTSCGSCCTYSVISGCTDVTALNYDSTAVTDDGSCIYTVTGCTDSTASNYNPLAVTDDGSCFESIIGCTDPNAASYNPNATIHNQSMCTYDTMGCTNPLAINYDPAATYDDGSCVLGAGGCTVRNPKDYLEDPSIYSGPEDLVHIPDDDFRKLLEYGGYVVSSSWMDSNGNPLVTGEYISKILVDTIIVVDVSITSSAHNDYVTAIGSTPIIGNYHGIQCFDALEEFNINGQTFSGLFGDNILDVAGLANLQILDCGNSYPNTYIHGIAGLNTCSSLIKLKCHQNGITSLDLSNNYNLEVLYCFRNQISTLDLGALPALKELACGDNLLTTLDASSNTVLDELSCFGNQLSLINVQNGNNANMGTGFFASSGNSNPQVIICDDAAQFATDHSANYDAWATIQQ